MEKNTIVRHIRDAFVGRVYQSLAILFCVLFGMAMIANTQLGGEAMWFWYATLFHRGMKLYADLHIPLQPLFVLESDAWMRLVGNKCFALESLSVIHILVLCLGIFLVLRESDWPNWQKATVLAGAFVVTVVGTSYRFDDYHVVAENLILYSLVLLLMLARAEAARRQLGLAAGLGVLTGFTITTRLTDGAALLVAAGICLLFLARKRKLLVAGLFVVAAALTVALVVKLTGDTFSDYVSNSILKAAGSKGGTGSILAAPFHLFRNALQLCRGRRWIFLWFVVIVAAGAVVQRYWKNGINYIVALQLGMAGAAFAISSHLHREELLSGALIEFWVLSVIVLNYLLAPIVVARYSMWKLGHGKSVWDVREVLVLLPLAELASYSAGAAAEPLTQYYAPIAMLLLLVPVIQPFRRHAGWANASFVTILALLGLTGITAKIHNPYSWQNYHSYPMFVNRQWYRHPVYGPLYIDRDQLRLSEAICADIGQEQSKPELLSLPYPFPNYFCDITPWRGYVQTFFDTSTRATIDGLMAELDTAPPQWIVYQRQLKIMGGSERLYNHGKPLAQRDLDTMILQKIATGQWQLVDRLGYPSLVDKREYLPGDGWYVIRTRP